MTYRLQTFRVQFIAEPAEFSTGSPCRSSADVERLARAIYQTLDADKEHFLLLAMNNKNRLKRVQGSIDGKPNRVPRTSPRSMALGASPLRCCRGVYSPPPERRPCTESRRSGNHAATQGNRRHARDSRPGSRGAWR